MAMFAPAEAQKTGKTRPELMPRFSPASSSSCVSVPASKNFSIRESSASATISIRASRAAAAALDANVRSYRYVRQWLASGQITDPMSPADPPGGAGLHQNVRGSTYYH